VAIFTEALLFLAVAVEGAPVEPLAQMASPEPQTLVAAVVVLVATTQTELAEMVVLA
jgi:hypothetical protein